MPSLVGLDQIENANQQQRRQARETVLAKDPNAQDILAMLGLDEEQSV